ALRSQRRPPFGRKDAWGGSNAWHDYVSVSSRLTRGNVMRLRRERTEVLCAWRRRLRRLACSLSTVHLSSSKSLTKRPMSRPFDRSARHLRGAPRTNPPLHPRPPLHSRPP